VTRFLFLTFIFLNVWAVAAEKPRAPIDFSCEKQLRTIKHETGAFVLFQPLQDVFAARALRRGPRHSGFIKLGEILFRLHPNENTLEIISTNIELKNRRISKLLIGSILRKLSQPEAVTSVILFENEDAYNEAADRGVGLQEAIAATPYFKALAAFGYKTVDIERSYLFLKRQWLKLSELPSSPAPRLGDDDLLGVVLKK
jgi:hypothetical protein